MRGVGRGVSGLVLMLGCWVCPAAAEGVPPTSERHLEFERETQNIRFRHTLFEREPRAEVREVCADLGGELRFGSIPHRLVDEQATSTENFVQFVAAFSDASGPTLLLDADRDGALECDEQVPLVAHPTDASVRFRSLSLRWKGDGGGARSQRYRLSLPAWVETSEDGEYSVDLVDVPVARWSVGGRNTSWVLYDGNHNGVFDSDFGDGILIDTSGEGRLDLDPYGDNFFSLHAPLELPWGTFEVTELDRRGRYLRLARVLASDVVETRPYSYGDVVPGLECQTTDGYSITLGGATGRHQLLYFWLSHCGTCQADMQAMQPMLLRIDHRQLSAVGVSLDSERMLFDDFVTGNFIEWPQCFSGRALWDNPLARRFGIKQPSDFVILDPAGRLVTVGSGFEQLEAVLQDLGVGLPLAADGAPPAKSWRSTQRLESTP